MSIQTYQQVFGNYQNENNYLQYKAKLSIIYQHLKLFQSFKLPIIALKVFQKYQDERYYQANIEKYQQILLPPLLFHHSFFILLTSLRILLKLSKFTINPKNSIAVEKLKNNIEIVLVDFNNIAILPPNPALKSKSLVFIPSNNTFKTSNPNFLSLIFLTYWRAFIRSNIRRFNLITNNIFNIIKSFGFDVVLNKRHYPRWNIIPISNSVITDVSNFSKFFFIQSSFFKKLFKLFISHHKPFRYEFNANYNIFCIYPIHESLTFCTYYITIIFINVCIPYILQLIQGVSQCN